MCRQPTSSVFSAEIGYWLGEAYWGRGIVTEALVLVTRARVRTANLLRLFALPFADNVGSIRVLEKAGYVREAILQVEQRQVRQAARPGALRPHQSRPGGGWPSRARADAVRAETDV